MEGLHQYRAEHRQGANAMKQTQPPQDYTPPTIDWTEEPERQPYAPLARQQRQTFIPANNTPAQWQPPTLARGDQSITIDVAPRATVQEIVRGDQVSQAKSFLWYSLPLAGAFGLVMVVIASIATPLISGGFGAALLKSIGLYFGSFLLAYGFLLFQHLKHSPAGVALKESDNVFTYLATEQAHRHEVENVLLDRYLEDSKRP